MSEPSPRDTAVMMVAAGGTIRAAATIAGVSPTTVARWVRAAGIGPRPRGPRARVPDGTVLATVDTVGRRAAARTLGLTKGGLASRLVNARARAAGATGAAATTEELVAARRAGVPWAALATMAGEPMSTVRSRVHRAIADGEGRS
jgi:hypothetical protein